MTVIQWAEPALLWGNRPTEQNKPQILELKSDDFLPEFLTAMKAEPDKQARSNPTALNFLNTSKWTGTKLYQPLHSRYYLVTASLVCHQVGLPDKEVNLKKGEKTFFVLRRLQGGVEQGWSDKRGWVAIADDGKAVEADEERFPTHPVSVCTGKDSTVVPCERKIYYGYVATGNRDKYLDKQIVSTPSNSGPEAKIKKFFEDANKDLKPEQQFDLNLQEFDTKVIASRDFLIRNSGNPKADSAVPAASLNILLDMIDIFQRVLPNVWKKIDTATRASTTLSGAQLNLYSYLEAYTIAYRVLHTNNTGYDTFNIKLLDALNELKTKVGIVYGDDSVVEPTRLYDVRKFIDNPAIKNELKDKVKAALDEAKPTLTFSKEDAEERAALIENQVRPVPTSGMDDPYFLRMFYDYDPNCPPIPSEPSSNFTIARNLEPDAPARLIRIEMPSIKPRDLRKFRHGVGMQLSPELRKVMDGVHEGMLKGEGLNDSSSWELGMICTFSIQIITLIAFVVMFIFAILLNIVFWWLAFLKICLPIPKKA